MKIICKYKDYYDYFGHVIGPGNAGDDVVYDRRDCQKLTDPDLVSHLMHYEKTRRPPHSGMGLGSGRSFVLEVGYTQYFMSLNIIDSVAMTGKFSLEKTIKSHGHIFKTPMSISTYGIHWTGNRELWRKLKDDFSLSSCKFDHERAIPNPILADTGLMKLIDPQDIWVALDQYLSSLKNDVNQESAGLTDKDKAINHGFSHPESFRNM